MTPFLSNIARFNDWYDRLPPGDRFWLFMSAMALAVFPLQLGLTFQHRGAALVGLSIFTLIVLGACLRAHRLGGGHRMAASVLLAGLAVLCLGIAFH